MLTKRTEISQVVDPNGNISVMDISVFIEDGVEKARAIHRTTLAPGDNVTSQPEIVAAVANAIWTPARVAAARQRQTARTAR